MFYGDLFKNTVTQPSTGLNRFAQGRNAFYQYIHDSLANGKPYNQMATRTDHGGRHQQLHHRHAQLDAERLGFQRPGAGHHRCR